MKHITAVRSQSHRRIGQFNAYIANGIVKDEPAVVFTAAYRPPGPAFAIPLSEIHNYFDEDALPTPYAREKFEKAAKQLGFHNDRHAVTQMLDGLYSMVDDLVKALPPELEEAPRRKGKVLGEMQLRIDGKLVTGEDVHQ